MEVLYVCVCVYNGTCVVCLAARVAGPEGYLFFEWTWQSRGEAWLSWSVGGNCLYFGFVYPYPQLCT